MGEPMNETAFRPDPEMFVCMDPTGCYHVSWNAEQHAAKMAQVGAKHEARYIAASPSPSMEMEVVEGLLSNGQPLVTLSQAQSALAAMRVESDEQSNNATKWFQNFSAAVRRAEAAEAQVLRLTEENEALRKERTSLIETKREQIDRLTADRDHNAAEYEKVLNSYADENQCFSDKLEAAEARIKDLEDEKAKALALLDHLVDWIVHDCGAEVPFSGEQDETYTTLQKEQEDAPSE